MRNLIKFSIGRPVFTLVTMTLFILLGAVSLTNIPLKLIPEIDPPVAAVVTSYDEAGPQEVVDGVSRPMETSLSTIEGLESINSISMEGSSLTLLEFSWTTSIEDVENDIIQNMNQTELPSGAGSPQFLKFDPSQIPIIQASISTIDNDNDNLTEQVNELETDLLQVDGVGSIDFMGDAADEAAVRLDQDLLEENNLTQEIVVQTLQSHNVTAPGGVVESGEAEISTRLLFEMNSVEDIENITLTEDPEDGEDVTVADVAEVSIAPEPTDMITRTNQDDAIMLSVQQQADANTADVSRAFINELDSLLEDDQYSDLDASILFNQGEYVDEAISNVALALIAGGFIAMAVLFAFLRNFKTPLLIGIAIPFSVIVTFVLLYFSNFSLNIMTLGGLALGIGMLVDNSIVVIENIYRHLNMKKDPKQAALDGTKEVATAITASTLTTISVFLPVVFIAGIVGNLFREFALTVAFSLLASLLVALTVVPMLASKWLRTPRADVETERRKSRFVKFFDSSARWSLRHRFTIVLLTLLLLVGGGAGVTTVGTEFLPATDEGFFQIDVENESGTPLESTFEDMEEIEAILDDENDVAHYTAVTGSSGEQGPMAGQGGSGHEGVVYVSMVPVNERERSTMDFSEDIRTDVERAAPDAEISITMDASFGSDPNTFSFDLSDSNPLQLEEVSEDLLEQFEDMSEFTEVTNTLEETVPELQLNIDDDEAREAGLTPAEIASQVEQMTGGALATQIVTEENDVYNVMVRYEEEFTETEEDLENLLLQTQDGDYIALGELAEFDEGESPEEIQRINQEESVQFDLTFGTDYNLGEINTIVQDEIDEYGLPDETSISYTGDQELLEDAVNDLTFALILAIVFVYLVMAAQFESLRYPFVIMFSVPLVVIGVAIALTLTRTPISVTAFIGLIVLVGIVVNNSIVLVDYINQRKEAGFKSADAIIEGVKDRARPILMTASTTILALVPLALGYGEGSEIQQPLAITVIGGMISATFLTLVLIPVLYSFMDKETRFMNRKYVTPDGQLIPAYLMEERYSDETGKTRGRYISDEKEDMSEYYRPAEDVPESGQLVDVEEDRSGEQPNEASQSDDPFMYDENVVDRLPSRKEKHRADDLSQEEILKRLESMIERNKNRRDDE
ncbi:efflux RND transporter permease subunit [Salisediminibacterium halotolerans]|uniref:efflux RND transporter permease subunit n=1 Tax=Salisediminibacterium halotolerans TaxID=517425 RepID=UPI000EAE7C81|nr:efflux RND transporter permease subunit [Salisediminibacterium halotolerans]RLJ74495.1 HAE1 family hydrophobic/amphiphilic exporter-1 [Actinophytocola xinjiangensis]RPE87412.1 HAE1 family hydrophobic/amphiphilic exporter-1 [Salisediminibacterium halotolerans]TWG35331.1 HAE1 family hydrophobic/amphiphilic exporter-1 [Salisediminibacterium halotolerans]GEL07963.1 multidrug ABC transporter [Salisediminibacterium halotolerans]